MKNLKLFLRLTCVSFAFFSSSLLLSQAPYSFNYQGVAMDGEGAALSNQTISLRISIHKGSANGNIEFQEEQSTTTSERGIFGIRIGEGIASIGTLSGVDWSSDSYFIQIEIDPEGGQNYVSLGSSQLYSVPYALYATTAGNANETEEDTLNLTLEGTVLGIENGNMIDLAVIQDGVEDADADPENELQTLSLSDNVLSISDGNSVNLPTNSGGGNGGGNSVWNTIDGNAVYDAGGHLLYNKNNTTQFRISSDDDGGFFDMYDENGNFTLFSFPFEDGAGFLGTVGPNGTTNIRLSTPSSRPDAGFFGVADHESDSKAVAFVASNGSGNIYTEGPNNNFNVRLTNLSGRDNNGFLAVYDSQENNKAGIYVDNNGQGRVFADFVDSFVDNPEKSGQKIIYTMLQGPESATYLRGTSTLENGTASIQFPRHFAQQISEERITVLITPLSADSKGIAVVKKSTNGFSVKELLQGIGNYSFDWEVKGVRSRSLLKSLDLPQTPEIKDSEREPSINEELKIQKKIKNQ